MTERPTILFDLYQLSLKSPAEIIHWLQEKGLIASYYKCPKCNINMFLRERKDITDQYCWRCNKCTCRRSIRKGTWFELSRLKLMDVVILTYMWVRQESQKNVLHELQLGSDKTITDWYSFCREICTDIVLNHCEQIGGPNVIVEIDELKFGKRKYHRGKRVEGKWVFGGVERGTNRCFLKVINDRSANTLMSLIKENIAPGTTIISDCWKAYESLGKEAYDHLTVNHSITFKNRGTDAHTNAVDSMWSCVKRKFHHTNRIPGMFDSYLSEFMYRRLRKESQDLFLDFLSDIIKIYPPMNFDTLSE